MRSGLLVLVVATFAAGCGNFSSVHRTLDTTSGQGVLIDIKQRAILAAQRPGNNSGESHAVVCAEPSPDALSAYAFDLAAQGSFPGGKSIGASMGSAESAAFIGLRTQSIQLLRDQFFRACEAYMNRAINAAEYNLLIRRYQKQTAALLAIEQLTSVISAPAASVSASGSASASTMSFLQAVFNENKEKIGALEKDRSVAGVDDEKKKSIQSEIDALKKQNEGIVEALGKVEPVKVVATTSGTVKESSLVDTKTDTSAVATVVQKIVDNITLTDDFLQICIANFTAPEKSDEKAAAVGGADSPKNLREACMDRLGVANNRLRLQNEIISGYLSNIINDKSLTPAEKREILKGISLPDTSAPGLDTKSMAASIDLNAIRAARESVGELQLMSKYFKLPDCDPKKQKDCK